VSITRSAVACILACGLLAIAASTATAGPTAEEQYVKSYGSAPVVDVSAAAAEAQEQYYRSYGPPPRDGASGETPWLAIVLASVAVVAAAGALGAARHRRRRTAAVRMVPA